MVVNVFYFERFMRKPVVYEREGAGSDGQRVGEKGQEKRERTREKMRETW